MRDKTQATTLTEAYEALRAFAIYPGTSLSPPRGLALFLHRGMPGWMDAWSSLVSSDRARAVRLKPLVTNMGAEGPLPVEAVAILANMALATMRREIL